MDSNKANEKLGKVHDPIVINPKGRGDNIEKTFENGFEQEYSDLEPEIEEYFEIKPLPKSSRHYVPKKYPDITLEVTEEKEKDE